MHLWDFITLRYTFTYFSAVYICHNLKYLPFAPRPSLNLPLCPHTFFFLFVPTITRLSYSGNNRWTKCRWVKLEKDTPAVWGQLVGGGGAEARGWWGSQPLRANRSLIQSLARPWLDAGQGSHFRSRGVIVGISLSTMSTMPKPYSVSAGAWHRLLQNYVGKDGRKRFFESVSPKQTVVCEIMTQSTEELHIIIHQSITFTFQI